MWLIAAEDLDPDAGEDGVGLCVSLNASPPGLGGIAGRMRAAVQKQTAKDTGKTCLRKKRLRICMMLLYSIVDDYGVCDRDGVGDAVASVWLIADALNGGGVWLIADASVWLIDEAAGTTVHTQLPRLAHGCAEMYTFVCTTVRNIAPPLPHGCAPISEL